MTRWKDVIDKLEAQLAERRHAAAADMRRLRGAGVSHAQIGELMGGWPKQTVLYYLNTYGQQEQTND